LAREAGWSHDCLDAPVAGAHLQFEVYGRKKVADPSSPGYRSEKIRELHVGVVCRAARCGEPGCGLQMVRRDFQRTTTPDQSDWTRVIHGKGTSSNGVMSYYYNSSHEGLPRHGDDGSLRH